MLTHHHRLVSLSIVSTDLPVWSDVQAIATIYQRDQERFHLLLTEPKVAVDHEQRDQPSTQNQPSTPRLLWLEMSPYRITMTMQGDGKLSYRHHWERGVYGISRYWLQGGQAGLGSQLQLRNFTRRLNLDGKTLPERLHLEYELWSDKIQLGSYVLNLDIQAD
ncbi:hypothetical protein C7B65_03295 [Phormidesmis priestleyi ULC007]|uniref:Uncharacterized protein n=2 Tax=Phormidesmis priestleyi TaxID=268141 RepID=A0A2T1DMC9_9CYAN|nr:hypothetical protein C7B65_03295 [Phormidesmis priestleyi ULC007]PZO54663.1 MAG: hypothetical protein DCF14_01815 [Phormidesmis priestleyi]